MYVCMILNNVKIRCTVRTRYHCLYDDLHLIDKGANLSSENILSKLNEGALPQSLEENPSSKSFSDFDYKRAKENAFTSTKNINTLWQKKQVSGKLYLKPLLR